LVYNSFVNNVPTSAFVMNISWID
jgi:hypothetical protein